MRRFAICEVTSAERTPVNALAKRARVMVVRALREGMGLSLYPMQVFLAPPRAFTLEDAIGYVAGDELIEVTPSSIRLRKRVLDLSARKTARRRGEGAVAAYG